MSDERRSEGTGAVVAIVVVFAIVLLLGVGVLVVGIGGFFFVSHRQVAPVQTATAMTVVDEAPPDSIPEDLSKPPAPTLDNPPLSLELTADSKIIVGGEEVAIDKLPEKLRTSLKEMASLRVIFVSAQNSNSEPHRTVLDLLQSLEVPYVLKDQP